MGRRVTPAAAGCGHGPAPAPPPELRAALLKLLYAPQGADPEEVAAMRAALPEGAAARIERASPAEWLPVAWEIAMLRAVQARGGEAAVRRVTFAAGRAARQASALRPLLDATIGMLGTHRAILVRVAASSLEISMRHAGRRGTVSTGPRFASVVHEDIPAAHWDRVLAVRMCGSIEGLLELGGPGARGEAEWTEGSTRAVYSFRW